MKPRLLPRAEPSPHVTGKRLRECGRRNAKRRLNGLGDLGTRAQREEETANAPLSRDCAAIPAYTHGLGAARNGATPEGIEPLEVDIFASTDFYADRALWSDKRYFRCNSPYGLEAQWRGGLIGDKPPASAAWGFCDRDYPREAIVSPYKFRTAQAHYEALPRRGARKACSDRPTRS